MSLARQLILAVTLLVLCILAGNLWLNVSNSRQYFSEQMQSLAEDAATSLGFSLSRVDLKEDDALAQSMVDAIFDHGYYQSIVVTDTANEVVVSRSRTVEIEGVPAWFINLVELPRYAGVAEVVSGWYRKGEVSIIAHPGYLYRELWRILKEQTVFLIFIATFCYGLAGLGLKYLLSPLHSIRHQADAISRKEFRTLEKIPATPELANIVHAMNSMVRKLKTLFQQQVDLTDQLRRDASMDALTQLPNREEFNRQCEAWLQKEEGAGPAVLILLHVKNLEALNVQYGRDASNTLLHGLADCLRQALGQWPRAMASRRSGSDFAIFIPGLLMNEVETWVKQFDQQIEELLSQTEMEEAEIYFAAAGSASIGSMSVILSAADSLLRQASQGDERWVYDSADEHHALCLTARAWVEKIKQVQQDNSLECDLQAVFNEKQEPIGYEMLARVREQGERVNAGVFWPLAERFHLVEELDKQMLSLALETLQDQISLPVVAVNVSPQSLRSAAFIQWLDGTLTSASSVDLKRLNIELPERILRMHEEDLAALLRVTQQHGVEVGLDHFGLVPSALGCLQKLPLSYVKIDQQFVHHHEQHTYYLRLLCQLAGASDVNVIAEGVENEAQWQAVVAAGVNAAQGYWLARPEPLA